MDIPTKAELDMMHNTVCKAVSEVKRIQIIYELGEKPCHVNQLADQLGMSQSTVSRHLGVLRRAGIVNTERDGTTVIYSLVEPRLVEVLNTMRSIMRDRITEQTNFLT